VTNDVRLFDALEVARPVYEIPDDDLVGEVLIPALAAADSVDIAVGFFTSQCLAQIAPGLADLIDRRVKCRLLVSPEITDEDRDAIDRGLSAPEEVLDSFMLHLIAQADADPISAHAADCLAYLVAAGTFDIRCVLMERGMFHKKSWTIYANTLRLGVHGSGNLTTRGLLVNGEQMTIDRPWRDGDAAAQRVEQLAKSFQEHWENQKPGRLTITPHQLVSLLKQRPAAPPPTTDDFWSAWSAARDAGLAPELPPNLTHRPGAKRLAIPSWLDWQRPPYQHQAKAIEALEARNVTGIVAMATGGGKTKTALVAVTRLQQRSGRPLLVTILVPTKTLAFQWADEVRDFGVSPHVLTGPTLAQRRRIYEDVELSLRASEPRTEVLIAVSVDDDLRSFLGRAADFAQTVLVADEAHNYGAAGFITNPPTGIEHRIALSATPIRQYDHEGTRLLFDYFETEGDPAFTFTLNDAIRAGCLTPYRYHIHPVQFTDEELDRYEQLTEQLIRSGFRQDDGVDAGLSERQKQLLRERRALIEQAEGKIGALKSILSADASTISHTLIYCSAKAVKPPHERRQIELAREVLRDLRISTHMYTAVETSKSDSRAFLRRFSDGDLQTLLAMKVLDEGVDVPAAHRAFLLASSTVEREWIQRRGRILRNAPGKVIADLHDFIVMPPDPNSKSAARLLRSELRRAEQFAQDSANYYDVGGPGELIHSIEQLL
jgi:superfamily II DNA or RNA helicase/HKD family nuclease